MKNWQNGFSDSWSTGAKQKNPFQTNNKTGFINGSISPKDNFSFSQGSKPGGAGEGFTGEEFNHTTMPTPVSQWDLGKIPTVTGGANIATPPVAGAPGGNIIAQPLGPTPVGPNTQVPALPSGMPTTFGTTSGEGDYPPSLSGYSGGNITAEPLGPTPVGPNTQVPALPNLPPPTLSATPGGNITVQPLGPTPIGPNTQVPSFPATPPPAMGTPPGGNITAEPLGPTPVGPNTQVPNVVGSSPWTLGVTPGGNEYPPSVGGGSNAAPPVMARPQPPNFRDGFLNRLLGRRRNRTQQYSFPRRIK